MQVESGDWYMLVKVEFENYRCFKKSSLDLRNIAIIVGKNNAGKSTIVEALRLIAAAGKKSKTAIYKTPPKSLGLALINNGFSIDSSKLKIDLHSVVHFYDEDNCAKITAHFQDGSKISIYLNTADVFAVIITPDGSIISRKAQARQLTIDKIDILPQIGLIKEKEKLLTEDTVKSDKDTYLSSRHFRNELLLFRDEYFEDFKSIAEMTWPGLRILEFKYARNEDEYISLFVQDDGFPAEIGLMGSGLQMWLQIIWFIARCAESETIILDEPDVYMHPDMQRKILDIVQNKYQQVIIATHSVEIISAVDAKNIVTIDKSAKKMKYANNSKAVQQIIDGIGSVHNLALVRLANSKKCLFVEGKDMKILSKLRDKLNIHTQQPIDTLPCIPLGGASKLSEAFGASKLFYEETQGSVQCFCILDRDYFPDEYVDEQMKAAQAAHLNLHIWKKKEIENYLLIPKAVFRIVDKQQSDYYLFLEKFDALISTQRDEIILQFANQLQIQDGKKKDLGSYYKEASIAVNASWNNLDEKLSIISGKSAISLINGWVRSEYHKHCSQAKIISAILPDEIDAEMVAVLKDICC